MVKILTKLSKNPKAKEYPQFLINIDDINTPELYPGFKCVWEYSEDNLSYVTNMSDSLHQAKLLEVSKYLDDNFKDWDKKRGDRTLKMATIVCAAKYIELFYDRIDDLTIPNLTALSYMSWLDNEEFMERKICVFGNNDLLDTIRNKYDNLRYIGPSGVIIDHAFEERELDCHNKEAVDSFQKEMIELHHSKTTLELETIEQDILEKELIKHNL